MASVKTFRDLALSFPEVSELPHFEKTSFRVAKKIFATMSEEKKSAMVKLSLVDQSVFCRYDPAVMYPVPNKWGLQGCTIIELPKIKKGMLLDALTAAYCEVAPKKLAEPLIQRLK